ncbi:MAG: hypothetical protein N2Z75_04235 [Meiothermus sp.]|uniref:hypothetical protein n=1 Tax=Meiothermus sp. TaxID=1955249 RepID=UPI0025E3EEDD|nr:hypothetical protein [Meiothermus sp.]MCS7068076.1 hypothetical protein [Meiothermus sp.]MCX7601133.1 hypothetical protein [Meiothermus sp.]MDW8425129.1 hypothetical protein [Meiothermus sp.]
MRERCPLSGSLGPIRAGVMEVGLRADGPRTRRDPVTTLKRRVFCPGDPVRL